jgi:hypothetical protein
MAIDFPARLADQLDKDQPQWYIQWATGSELEAYSIDVLRCTQRSMEMGLGAYTLSMRNITQRLRSSVANRLFHRILNAASAAGIFDQEDPEGMPPGFQVEKQTTGDWAVFEGEGYRTSRLNAEDARKAAWKLYREGHL